MEYPIFNTSVNEVFEVNGTAEIVKNADWLFVSADAVFARIEIDEDAATDVKASYIQNPATAVPSGTYLKAGFSSFFSAITLTSGSVTMILRNKQ